MIKASTTDFLYRQEVLRDRPVLYWPLDRKDMALDYRSTTSPYTSLSHGTQNLAQGAFPGTVANSFDQNTNYYRVPYAAGGLNTQQFTIEAWACPTALCANNQVNAIVWNWNGTSNGWRLWNWFNEWWAYGENQWFDFQSVTVPKVGQWAHLVAQSNFTNYEALFVNGVLDSTFNFNTNDMNTAGDYFVGASSTAPASVFSGEIAHVAQYNYLLSPKRIAEHYKVGKRLMQQQRTPLL